MKVYTPTRRNGHGVSDEEHFRRMLDATPRPPELPAFLAEFHKRQAFLAPINARREIRRKRYERRFQRIRISRQADHGPGEILGTGYASSGSDGGAGGIERACYDQASGAEPGGPSIGRQHNS